MEGIPSGLLNLSTISDSVQRGQPDLAPETPLAGTPQRGHSPASATEGILVTDAPPPSPPVLPTPDFVDPEPITWADHTTEGLPTPPRFPTPDAPLAAIPANPVAHALGQVPVPAWDRVPEDDDVSLDVNTVVGPTQEQIDNPDVPFPPQRPRPPQLLSNAPPGRPDLGLTGWAPPWAQGAIDPRDGVAARIEVLTRRVDELEAVEARLATQFARFVVEHVQASEERLIRQFIATLQSVAVEGVPPRQPIRPTGDELPHRPGQPVLGPEPHQPPPRVMAPVRSSQRFRDPRDGGA